MKANRRCRFRTRRSGASSAGFSARGRPSRFERASAADARLWRRPSLGTGSERVRAAPSSNRRLPRRAAGRSPKTRRIQGTSRRGSTALVVARYSSGAGGNRRGRIRSLALVGKLFPTMDPDHPMPLRTANFITQEDIGGERSDSINAAELRNAPDVTVFRRGPAGTLLIKVASVFRRVDAEPTIRQLYPIAELGKPAGEPTRAPAFMRLLVAPEQPVIAGADLDVRDEVMAQIFDRGDPVPKRTLTFTIDVTDDGTHIGIAVPRAPHVPELAADRHAGVRQRRRVVQRRRRHSFCASDLAAGSQRSGNRHARRWRESPLRDCHSWERECGTGPIDGGAKESARHRRDRLDGCTDVGRRQGQGAGNGSASATWRST